MSFFVASSFFKVVFYEHALVFPKNFSARYLRWKTVVLSPHLATLQLPFVILVKRETNRCIKKHKTSTFYAISWFNTSRFSVALFKEDVDGVVFTFSHTIHLSSLFNIIADHSNAIIAGISLTWLIRKWVWLMGGKISQGRTAAITREFWFGPQRGAINQSWFEMES